MSDNPTLRLLSLGAGVQSTTLALMACQGELGQVDGAIFADTQWEPKRVYEHLHRLRGELDQAGIPLHVVTAGNLRADSLDPSTRFTPVPYFTVSKAGVEGMGRRQCTHQYKLRPIYRKVRELLGAKAPDFRRVPRGRVAEVVIGFSTDEIGRVSDRHDNLYTKKLYPLLDRGMSRSDCDRWLKYRGWTGVSKSACIGCPLHGNQFWRDLRDNDPEGWADAVDFDARIRNGGANPIDGQAFLHSSRKPLPLAPVDRVSQIEWANRQIDILDELVEQGDPDGCSPWGCRSGAPVKAVS
jgi:hypothetical protein